MDKVATLDKIKNIGTCEDEIARRTLLAELTDEIEEVFTSHENLTADHEQLKQNYADAQEANTKLFLRLGSKEKADDALDDGEPQKRKYEDLFDEKGRLKRRR